MYLIQQILLFLALAALIGFAAGWYWRRCREGATVAVEGADAGESNVTLLAERDGALSDLRARLAAAPTPDQLDALRRDLAAKDAVVLAAQRQLADLRDQLAATLNLDALRRQRDEALAAKTALEKDVIALKGATNQTPALSSFEALHRKTEELRVGTEATRKYLESIGAQFADAAQLRGLLGQASEAKTAAETQANALRERLAQATSERDAALEKLRALETQIATLRSEIETLRTSKGAADSALAALRRETEGMARLTAERDGAMRQADGLNQNLQAALSLAASRRERDEAVSVRATLETQIAQLRAQLGAAPPPGELDALRTKLSALEARYAGAAQEVQDLRGQLRATPDISGIERERDAALADRARLAQMLEGLRAQLSVGPNVEWRRAALAAPAPRAIEPIEIEARYDNAPLAALTPQELAVALDRVVQEVKPIALVEPLTVPPDNLRAIGGVTPAIERWLHEHGFFLYWQFSTLTAPGAAWLQRNLPLGADDSFVNEHWIAQAARLRR